MAQPPAQAHTRRGCESLGRTRPLGSIGRPFTGVTGGSVTATLVPPALVVVVTSALVVATSALLSMQPMLFVWLSARQRRNAHEMSSALGL